MEFDARKEKNREETVVGAKCRREFTEDREEWQKEVQRNCEGEYADPEETREVQEKGITYFRNKGDPHFTDGGRGAGIGAAGKGNNV